MRTRFLPATAYGLIKVLGLITGIAFAPILVGPIDVAAQDDCSRCTSCDDCDRDKWGGNGCSMSGGCCREIGGNCNPELAELIAQGVAPKDLVSLQFREGVAEPVVLTRVSDAVLSEWDCTGQVRALYWREEVDAPADAAISRYTLAGYLATHAVKLAGSGV